MQFTHTDYNSLNTVHCAAMLVQLFNRRMFMRYYFK